MSNLVTGKCRYEFGYAILRQSISDDSACTFDQSGDFHFIGTWRCIIFSSLLVHVAMMAASGSQSTDDFIGECLHGYKVAIYIGSYR